MMYNESISQELYDTIQELMQEPLLNEFYLGGGTCLAIKYNYRISIDIDLFSSGIVGKEKMKDIFQLISEKYKIFEQNFALKNETSENLAFTTGILKRNEVNVKIDIIQNMGFLHPFEVKNGIRLVNDLDIGALKLLSIVGRGTRKDFYDLYYLSNIYGIDTLYDELMRRQEIFVGKEHENIFNIPTGKPLPTLEKNVSPLCDFTNANLTQYNKVVITDPELQKKSWFDISQNWENKVSILAELKGLDFEKTPKIQRKRNNFRF